VALGRHDNVVNSIRGQQGGVAHRGGCSTVVGGRPEGNNGGGGVWERWSTARGAGRWYTVAQCSWRRRGARRGTGAALHGGSTATEQGSAVGATGGRKKGCSRGFWAPFIAGRGGGRRRRGGESGGGETAVGKQRCWRCRGSDRLPSIYASRRQLSDQWARAVLTGWVGTVNFLYFEIQNKDHPDVHKCSNLHGARVDYSEQLLPLGPLPIPNRIPVIKFGTNSTLNLSLNF
jgi:hypothetical protein